MFAFKTIWLFPFSENTFFMFLQFYILSQNQGGKFLILIQLSSLIQFPFASGMFTSNYIYHVKFHKDHYSVAVSF